VLELPTHLARDVITYLVSDLRTQPRQEEGTAPEKRLPKETPVSGVVLSPLGPEEERKVGGGIEPDDCLLDSLLCTDPNDARSLILPQKETVGDDDWAKDMAEQEARRRSGSTTTDGSEG